MCASCRTGVGRAVAWTVHGPGDPVVGKWSLRTWSTGGLWVEGPEITAEAWRDTEEEVLDLIPLDAQLDLLNDYGDVQVFVPELMEGSWHWEANRCAPRLPPPIAEAPLESRDEAGTQPEQDEVRAI